MEMTNVFKLGLTYKDKITGFRGVATGHVRYITGCNQVLLAPPVDDGKARDPAWFDEQRCELVPDGPVVVLDNGDTPGFDAPAPRR